MHSIDELPPLIATSVVRGTQQGESHGGVYLIDFAREHVVQTIDWNTMDIDWRGRGWDRGLRGIAFDGDAVYIAASDELFVYTPDFELRDSYRNPYLKHCHEIATHERRLYLTSTGFDSLLTFDLDKHCFVAGLHVTRTGSSFRAAPFNPVSDQGPPPGNELHLNSVYCAPDALYVSGTRTGGLLAYTGRRIVLTATLPQGVHNARPYRDGVLFNDTQADMLRFATPDRQRALPYPRFDEERLTHRDLADSRIARQAFGRGLCTIGEHLVATGSSPSTVAIHEIDAGTTRKIVTLTMDVRNAIHGLEIWPY